MEQHTKATTNCSNDLVDPLRAEIIESQKARIDLLKYKLIAIAALGSIGLGLGSNRPENAPLILALIPLVCLYVDLLCYHNTMRILVIGQFFKKNSCPYETFIAEAGGVLSDAGLYLFRKNKGKTFHAKCNFRKLSDKSNNNYVSSREIRNEVSVQKETSDEKRKKPYKSGAGYFFELEDVALQWSTIFLSLILSAISIFNIITKTGFSSQSHTGYILAFTGIAGMILSYLFYKGFEKHKDTLFVVVQRLGESLIDEKTN
ncbi:hypothetical protein A3E89_01940 [Candidatus Campbellbacteria bacterium RIFCSPHIGHO2_12_FULL_35_10]|uniref:Uncharacterized protein n=1 Tax=Candidatus Campbellbacteria bacterium RIFCSPHIGHO2_12_FULL_35_10 TaxID=1797578 RepID=A0A1F5EQE5_9BACT|nr:MAG: hypothetical protein A3E89_01940 [Candidatus Campbellbacteria bacterium RIFCSPHIGHO2_12_FULL_35_10]